MPIAQSVFSAAFAFALNKAGLVPDSQCEFRKAMSAERILKRLLAERGEPKASVRIETETLPPSSIRLRFIIDEDGNLPKGPANKND